MNFKSNFIEEYGELVAAVDRYGYQSKLNKLDFAMKYRETSLARPFVE